MGLWENVLGILWFKIDFSWLDIPPALSYITKKEIPNNRYPQALGKASGRAKDAGKGFLKNGHGKSIIF